MRIHEAPSNNANELEEAHDLSGACFAVINAPASRAPKMRPLLILRTTDGEIHIPREPASWASSLLRYRSGNAHVPLRVIGRLYQYTSVAFADIPITEDSLPTLVWNYVAFRIGDRVSSDPATQLLPHWYPVQKHTAQVEFDLIVDYLQFCHDKFQTLPMFSAPVRLKTFPTFNVRDDRDFFLHLRGHRERMRKLLGEEADARPNLVEVPSLLPRRSSAGQTMPRDEIDLIISAERNPVFKALWILLAYGGIRVSEALNLWCCDMMSGEMVGEFEPGFKQRDPLVILADPVKSRFTGSIHDTSRRRSEVLLRDFGLVPRPDYHNKHPLRAGWKGMLFTNPQLRVSWVYWSYPEPAREFLKLVAQILNIRRNISATKLHPYFFVNISDSSSLGGPQKYSNVAKAFARACERVGLEPHVAGRHIHGNRHFFKFTLKTTLKLDAEIVQVMMHHKNIESQRDYASSATVHGALKEAFSRFR